jgi:hypothetical protein
MYLTINQALNIWDKLVSAYYGTNTYGGNVAEIYLYECMEHSPIFARNSQSTFAQDDVERAKYALKDLMNRFRELYSDARLTDEEGAPVELIGTHRWHIKVVSREDQ